MKVGEYCKKAVVTIAGDALHKPVGVLTDRDLVLGVMARDVDPYAVTGIGRVPVVDARAGC
jgi:hypothetical protein